ncbi:hypothetical protein RUND412_008770 [Rhizina undulata]
MFFEPHTCQCPQCRKQTGSLIIHLITVPPSTITWSTPAVSFREYCSSPGIYRGFCESCGSGLTWRNEAKEGEIEIFTGTMDEEVLMPRGLGAAEELGRPSGGQLWCRRFIAGITDGLKEGVKYVEGSRLGETMP